ncbi:MAG: hypothetical protein M3N51_00815 [Actinomycetota bacterium]|nr:hypothetical protein [Actinomycetota bacterium]
MSAPGLAVVLSTARLALSVTLILAPPLVLRPWLGADAGRPAFRAVGRGMGVRDAALALGALLALRHRGGARGWLEAAALADLGDAAATLIAWRHLPRSGRVTLPLAFAAAVANWRLARQDLGRPTTP